MNSGQRTLLFWAALILVLIAIYNVFKPAPAARAREQVAPFHAVMETIELRPQSISRLTIEGRIWRLKMNEGETLICEAPPLQAWMLPSLNGLALNIVPAESFKNLVLYSWLPMIALILATWGPIWWWTRRQRRQAASG